MIEQVFEFNHRALGVQPKEVPQLEQKHARFCVKAIREEAKELEDEHVKIVVRDVHEEPIQHEVPHSPAAILQTVKSVDALIDGAYFAIGGLARAGLTVEQAVKCMQAVHDANMTKKMGVNGNRGDMGVADATKPADFVPPENAICRILFGIDLPAVS